MSDITNGWNEIDDKSAIKELIQQADSALLFDILKAYDVKIDEYNKKCRCPFSFHNERTGSFTFYKDTNSFFCYGCKTGGGPVIFVSAMEGIERPIAAKKILSKFHTDTNTVARNTDEFIGRQQLFLSFSNMVRNFITENLDDNFALKYSEKVTLIFDTLNFRHELDNKGLKSLIDKLQIKLSQYKCQQQF